MQVSRDDRRVTLVTVRHGLDITRERVVELYFIVPRQGYLNALRLRDVAVCGLLAARDEEIQRIAVAPHAVKEIRGQRAGTRGELYRAVGLEGFEKPRA